MQLVSESINGGPSSRDNYLGGLSGDGRFVASTSEASDLVPYDKNFAEDVFVRDLQSGDTVLVNQTWDRLQGNNARFGGAVVAMSQDGRYIVFSSFASNLVPDDTNEEWDVFLVPNPLWRP